MDAWKLLFGSDIGWMSVLTIVGATVFVVYMYGYIKKNMEVDAKNAAGK